MSKLNTMYSSSALNKIDKMPETISELYNLAIELNQRISNCLAKILPDLAGHTFFYVYRLFLTFQS
jgi:RNA processing factor Prp31